MCVCVYMYMLGGNIRVRMCKSHTCIRSFMPFCTQYLKRQSDRFYPEHLFEDVQRSVFELHHSRQIHKHICSDLGTVYSHLLALYT